MAEKPYEVVNFCEFDKYASTSYCAVHNEPESKNLGDITLVDETALPHYKMICGGSPCFPAGTKINTNKGLKNIEDIKCGDMVMTHNNRYMVVDKVGGEVNKEIYVMKAQGTLDTYATSYHPFYVKRTRESVPEKLEMCEIKKGFYISSQINTISYDNEYLTNELCWILGRYVADGHIRNDERKDGENGYYYSVILSIGADKVEDVKSHITSYNFSCYEYTDSVFRVVISNKELVEFIKDNNFGTSAITKNIPQCILNLPVEKLRSFVDGYMSGDGCEIKDSGLYSATTISKELALTLRDAIHKAYRVGCRVYYNKTEDTHVICGRTVNQHDTYIVRFIKDTSRKHLWFIEDDKVWYPVKSVEPTDRVEDVYNIEVRDDHTYIANGVVCFNCQDFSVAGKQEGSKWICRKCGRAYNPITIHFSERDKCPNCGCSEIDKSRSSLLVEWLRVIRANKPDWAIYENVKNIVGKQFKQTFDMFIAELEEYGYNCHWKVLNAKDYGVPQNRERVYVIIIKKELDNGLFEFPEPFDSGKRLKDVLEDEVDEKFYINTDKAKALIEELIASGKLNKQISNSVRCGGQEV